MDTIWLLLIGFLNVISNYVCYGYPIDLQDGGTDSQTQLLTGLIAVLLTVCCIVALAGCLCCTKNNGFKENKKEFRDSPVVVSVANNLDYGHVNPIANGEFTIFTPLSPPHYNNNIFLANQGILTRDLEDYRYGDIDIESWFKGPEKEFPRSRLKYIRELGKGWFGRVVEGAAQDTNDAQSWTPVVVRILEANSSTKDRILFLNDANYYRFGTHPNILGLLGRSLDTVPMLLIQEYCSKGDVKKYLRENVDKKESFLTSELPLRWCYQISIAIKHLHEQNIAHPDLAARNCLLMDDLNLKIGDYGLSSSNYPEDYYLASPGLSVRWCSPESVNYTSTTIQPNKITLEGNIWSFGVTMWEIFECGSQPYSHLSDDEVITQVLGPPSVRLPKPSNIVLYTDYMYRLMQMCWTNFEIRPKITQIELMLDDLMQIQKNMKLDKESIGSFDERWNNLKPNTIVKTDNQITENKNEVDENNDMESWLENIATNTDDLSYVRGLHDAMNDLDNVIALENVSSSESSHRPSPAPQKAKLEFKLGPMKRSKLVDSFKDSLPYVPKTSSESETEEENWKKKIEKGVYSEKVRQKSRSVTDLMVLTHIDCSESDSETPLQSLDYRVNYKNVRITQNLENTSLMFGSEGNLLNVKETFQEELRKLREERKDSLLFVPVTNMDTESLPDSSSIVTKSANSTELMQDIKSVNQVYNVYNVTVQSQFNPEYSNNNKLKDIINFHDLISESKPDISGEKLPDIISDITKRTLNNGEPDSTNSQEELIIDIPYNHIELAEFDLESSLSKTNTNNCDETNKCFTEDMQQVQKTNLNDYNQNEQIYDNQNSNIKIESDSDTEEDNTQTAINLIESPLDMKRNELNENVIFGSCSDYTIDLYAGLKTSTEAEELQFSSNFNPNNEDNDCLNYSLDSWDNFLDKALEKQDNEVFDNFNSEPTSLNLTQTIEKEDEELKISDDMNETFIINPNETFIVESNTSNDSDWENGEGWFLHDQSTNEELTGEMIMPENNSDTYVGFSMDDDVMSAIRNELLMKLPHAQRVSNEKMLAEEESDTGERIEVFIKFNTPLSPIPEESSECNSCQYTPRREESEDESDWTEPALQSNIEEVAGGSGTHSPQMLESAAKEMLHRHTPSQDSCCSNDTLFNLEELMTNEQDKSAVNGNKETDIEENDKSEAENHMHIKTNLLVEDLNESQHSETRNELSEEKYKYINDFILNERSTMSEKNGMFQIGKHNVPLPSPEDRQWKELHAPFLTCNIIENKNFLGYDVAANDEREYVNVNSNWKAADYVNTMNTEYVNCVPIYENDNNPRYINIDGNETIDPVYVDSVHPLGEKEEEERLDDIYGPLTDIRFTGPCDNQLMSTSFSESNDLGDEQDWDSGSDTRSSSSGEFLWKHDEHEESVKALSVAPQENAINEIVEMDENEGETSESTGSEEEGDGPEFVPSAWDKYAIPSKSAMRSPEKTLEKPDKKSKGVWFKKQKYHCVYEYPKEPESPILQNCDIWKPTANYLAGWNLEQNCFETNGSNSQDYDVENVVSDVMNNAHSTSLGGDFYISSSTRPFDNISSLGSEFFPGRCNNWSDFIKFNDNITPDSGIDDLTPDVNETISTENLLNEVQPLKQLAAYAVNKANNQKVLGGLRHTRNKLKLDLPPSPTAFSSTKIFNLEPHDDLVVRSVPTFTTFGKSRFLVQHVDTPTDEKSENYKNVSFEALPHKPLKTQILKDDSFDKEKQNVETVRGEASLLDSADEDSGIESCTLERRKMENLV